MIRSIVVLPQPDGPTNTATSPRPSTKPMSRSTSSRSPAAVTKVFCSISTSSSALPPAGRMSFKGLHQECFDRQHNGREGPRIGEDVGNVEQLERSADLEADAVRSPQQFGDEHDLPHERQAGARGRRNGGG